VTALAAPSSPAPVEPPPPPCVCGAGPAILALWTTQGQPVPLCATCVDYLTVRMVLARVRPGATAEPIAS
jgi:hypothetical protein